MNNDRRKRLQKIVDQLAELGEQIEDILAEEQEAFENMPESLQTSERGTAAEEAISNLEMANLSEIVDYLQAAIDG